jgi:hypothetical protein
MSEEQWIVCDLRESKNTVLVVYIYILWYIKKYIWKIFLVEKSQYKENIEHNTDK